MRRALVAVAPFLLLLAACSAAAPAEPPGAVTAASPSSVPAASSSSALTTTAPTTTAPTRTAQAAGPCRLADLGVEVGAPETSGIQQELRVVWTNTSGGPCTMVGFGGVDLRRTPGSRAELPEPQRPLSDSLSVPRTDRPPSPVRLEPGERAHSTITFVPLATTDPAAFVPSQVLATPPDETHSAVLRWNGGGLLRQEATGTGATGTTYLEPVRVGAS